MQENMNFVVSIILSVIGILLMVNNKKMVEICLRCSINKVNRGPLFFIFQRIMIGIAGATFFISGVWGIVLGMKRFF